jgi:hypothetical protein
MEPGLVCPSIAAYPQIVTDRSSARREGQLVEAVTHQSLELRGILGSVGTRYPRSVLPEEAHDIEGGLSIASRSIGQKVGCRAASSDTGTACSSFSYASS